MFGRLYPGMVLKVKISLNHLRFFGKEVKFIDIPKTQLEKYLPDFLVKEPFGVKKI